MKLSNLKTNQYAKVLEINIKDQAIKRHLLEMGLTKNVKIRVVNIAPLGDPISIELRGYELALRKSEANCIFVEVM